MDKSVNTAEDKLRWLCGFQAVSGMEENFVKKLADNLKKQGFSTKTDNFYNLLCCKSKAYADTENINENDTENTNGTSKLNVLLITHTDEAGFIVSDINQSGSLKFEKIGNIPKSALLSRFVESHNGLNGVISAKAMHLLTSEERQQYPKSENLFIDIGAADKKSAVNKVLPGDRFGFAREFTTLGDDIVCGTALGDRIGCFTALKAADTDADERLRDNINLYVLFAAQKHVGSRGIKAVMGDNFTKKIK